MAPAALILGIYHGTWEIVPVVATFFSGLRIVPRRCARLTYLLDPKLRKIDAPLIAPNSSAFPEGSLLAQARAGVSSAAKGKKDVK